MRQRVTQLPDSHRKAIRNWLAGYGQYCPGYQRKGHDIGQIPLATDGQRVFCQPCFTRWQADKVDLSHPSPTLQNTNPTGRTTDDPNYSA